jgi:hypothetical protein
MHSQPHLHADAPSVSASWTMLLPAVPALAIVLLWCPSLPASFQFDDWNVIVNDARLRSLAAWWQSMPGIRPLLKLSYALNIAVDMSPIGFRAVNVLIHALSATLVYRLLRVRGLRAGLPATIATRAALLAALLFALHPVQTEAVTYLSGRSSSLAACFCLLSLCCWVRSEQSTDARGNLLWLAACCVTFVAAVGCKETALVLPVILLLYSADRPLPTTLKRLSPLLALTVLMMLVAFSLPTYRYLLSVSLDTRTLTENVLTQSRALVYLAGQLVRINNGNIDPQLTVVTELDLLSCALCLAWVALLVGALLRVRKAPVGAFAVLWFLLWLAPTNSLLPRLDVANDRQLYLALIGSAWWVAVRVANWQNIRPWIGNAAVVLLLAPMAYATFQRNRIYDTEITFWQDTTARNPHSARAANNLGMAYALECRIDDAIVEFKRSIALNPKDYRAIINLRLLRQDVLPGVDLDRCQSTPHRADSAASN